MNKSFFTVVLIGVVIAILLNLALVHIPVLDNLVPDKLNTLITGLIAGGIIGGLLAKKKEPKE